MKVALASDHGAYEIKEEVKSWLTGKGYDVKDYGIFINESSDYPDTIKLAARSVAAGESDRGVVLCSSGIGASIVANKIRGIRAILCLDEYSAEYSRKHNDTNVIALAGKRMTFEECASCLEIWFKTEFDGGRHLRRVEKITEIENEECRR